MEPMHFDSESTFHSATNITEVTGTSGTSSSEQEMTLMKQKQQSVSNFSDVTKAFTASTKSDFADNNSSSPPRVIGDNSVQTLLALEKVQLKK
jgi:hypothetical protein